MDCRTGNGKAEQNNDDTKKKNTQIIDWQSLRPQVTTELLQEITDRIVEWFHLEKVILFGSYAYGDPTSHSDVDLLVVMKSDDRPATQHPGDARLSSLAFKSGCHCFDAGRTGNSRIRI